jgi:hypothetical protein
MLGGDCAVLSKNFWGIDTPEDGRRRHLGISLKFHFHITELDIVAWGPGIVWNLVKFG